MTVLTFPGATLGPKPVCNGLMGLAVKFSTPIDVARAIEGLLYAAEHVRDDCPLLADAWTGLADQIGDALDAMPTTSIPRVRTEQAMRHIERYLREGERLNGLPKRAAGA